MKIQKEWETNEFTYKYIKETPSRRSSYTCEFRSLNCAYRRSPVHGNVADIVAEYMTGFV